MRPTTNDDKKAAGTFTPTRSRAPLGVAPGVPEAPPWLSEAARREWDQLVPDLMHSAVLARIDRMMLSALCELYAEFGVNPRAFSAGKLKELRMMCAEFGCSVSSRLKMKAPEGLAPPIPIPEPQCTPKTEGNVVSISRLLSGTPKGSLPETSPRADTSASPASDS